MRMLPAACGLLAAFAALLLKATACGLSSSSSSTSSGSSSSYLNSKKRFWYKSIITSASSRGGGPLLLEDVQSFVDRNVEKAERIESGLVILGNGLAVPIIDSKAQTQYAVRMSNNTSAPRRSASNEEEEEEEVKILAFYPRAVHVTVSPDAEERPVVSERVAALGIALAQLSSTNTEELLSERYAGTSASRIYRSFVCPRPNRKAMLESVERGANRTAAQIELSMRQIRADEASYLRNIDKSVLEIRAGEGSVPHGPGLEGSHARLNPVVIVLDNVRSAFNVGSIFRTADAGGCQSVITTGITCHGTNPKLRKTAFSSIDSVPTQHFDDVIDCIQELKRNGYTVVAMETTSRSKVYTEVSFPKKIALVAGNEISGVDTRVMEAADMIVEIPTYGTKNSLNVCSATSIILMEILRQYRENEYI